MGLIFSQEIYKDRVDLTHLYTITIDPPNSLEFDDSFSINRFGINKYLFVINIADVASQVEIGSNLDNIGREKNRSFYDPYNPMFSPEVVDKLSLKEGEEKLGRSILIHMNNLGKFDRVEVVPSIILVNRNLTYEQAIKVGKSDSKLYRTLRNLETVLGSLEFSGLDFEESTNNFSKPKKLVQRGMILANTLAATFLYNRGIKFLNRSFYNRRNSLPPLNYIAELLAKQGCAFYSVGSHPHEALSLRRYTHWTSPIRRYPDIVVGRQLAAANEERRSLSTNSLQSEQNISNLKLVHSFGLV